MEKTSITLTSYTEADLPALTALMHHWSDERNDTADALRARLAAVADKSDDEIWLAKNEQGELLGYAQIGPVYLATHEPFYELKQLLVDKGRRGQGVGGVMLAAIEKIVFSRGFKEIRLSSRMEREAAHRFYRKNGYSEFKCSRFFRKQIG